MVRRKVSLFPVILSRFSTVFLFDTRLVQFLVHYHSQCTPSTSMIKKKKGNYVKMFNAASFPTTFEYYVTLTFKWIQQESVFFLLLASACKLYHQFQLLLLCFIRLKRRQRGLNTKRHKIKMQNVGWDRRRGFASSIVNKFDTMNESLAFQESERMNWSH